MVQKHKRFVLILTLAIGLVIFLIGQFNIFSTKEAEFSTTPRPLTAFNESQKQGQPIFLEFYASW